MTVKLITKMCFAAALTTATLAFTGVRSTEPTPTVTDVYDLKMVLRVPRIYDNNQSTGSRKYQTQRISGEMLMLYGPSGELVDVLFRNMVNKTHRLSDGSMLTYPDTRLNDIQVPRFNAIGSNKTGQFKTASICFSMAAEPSYNVGDFDEDNALYVTLAGRGSFSAGARKNLKTASGKVAGTLGCGCMAYGHTSPTRRIGYWGATDVVDDVAAVDGTWSMRFNSSKSSKR